MADLDEDEVPDGYWERLMALLENAPLLVEEPGDELDPIL
jgi:hypothetical protein